MLLGISRNRVWYQYSHSKYVSSLSRRETREVYIIIIKYSFIQLTDDFILTQDSDNDDIYHILDTIIEPEEKLAFDKYNPDIDKQLVNLIDCLCDTLNINNPTNLLYCYLNSTISTNDNNYSRSRVYIYIYIFIRMNILQ